MSDGSEFQVCGAATENARRANSVRVLAADSSGASHTTGYFLFILYLYCSEFVYNQANLSDFEFQGSSLPTPVRPSRSSFGVCVRVYYGLHSTPPRQISRPWVQRVVPAGRET